MDVIACPSCGTKNRVPATASGVPRCGKCHQPLPWIVDAGAAEFDQIVSASRLPIVVDLWAPWCGPCRTVSPLLEQLARELAGRIRLVKVNVDQAPAVQARASVCRASPPSCSCGTAVRSAGSSAPIRSTRCATGSRAVSPPTELAGGLCDVSGRCRGRSVRRVPAFEGALTSRRPDPQGPGLNCGLPAEVGGGGRI